MADGLPGSILTRRCWHSRDRAPITQSVNASLEAGCITFSAVDLSTMPDSLIGSRLAQRNIPAIAGRIPDAQGQILSNLPCTIPATQGGLPDDDEIAFITTIAVERIAALRPYLEPNRQSVRTAKLSQQLQRKPLTSAKEYSAKKRRKQGKRR